MRIVDYDIDSERVLHITSHIDHLWAGRTDYKS